MIRNWVKTRIPTGFGEFQLYLYNEKGKEHLALVSGDVSGQSAVPVRVHSECLTGDVFGSRRCDCGDQLKQALHFIGRSPCGILIYLRQEGRGIGLSKKLEAYNLQDQGMDTVEANIHLGHQPDERDYGIAAHILEDLKVRSIRLITNNPHKVDELKMLGIQVDSRIPIEVGQYPENREYLRSKASKMSHLLTFRELPPEAADLSFIEPLVDQLAMAQNSEDSGPFVTLAYAQSLDGSIAAESRVPYALSSVASLTLTHYLRSRHDGLLVGVNTILSDDPLLTVRYCEGDNPRPVILDSHLRTPPDAKIFSNASSPPLIITTGEPDPLLLEPLKARGAEILVVPADPEGGVDLPKAMAALRVRGIRTLMVEGGAKIICKFLKQKLVNYCVITITPKLIGGLNAVDGTCRTFSQPPLTVSECRYHALGSDLIAFGQVSYQ